MNIYIDNNVLIDYEKDNAVLPVNNDLCYYYSYVHIDEMMELGNRLEAEKCKRLDTIKNLTKGRCLFNNDDDVVSVYYKDPYEIFSICNSSFYKELQKYKKELHGQFNINEKRVELIEDLKTDIRKLNNYSAKEIVNEFGTDLFGYVNNSAENFQTGFQSLFNFLDMIGFWADKYTSRSNLARSYDANHAYFATFCDFFVTDDKKTMNKANVAYQLYGYKTVAISRMDFITTQQK